jgi:hypothetical protein
MRGRALFPSTRIRTAPQFPHLHSTVGLGVSSAGGPVGTVSTSGAGTTLRVFCGRAGITATSSVPNSTHAVYSSCGLFIKLQRSHTTTAEPNWLHREAGAGSVQSPRSVAGEAASGRARNIPELNVPHQRLELVVQKIALAERASRAHNYSRLSITPR